MTERRVWRLKLYVAGESASSLNACANLRRLCTEHLRDKCKVEVIDIIKNPSVASDQQILAIPTLVKQLPLPEKRFVGDLSNTERLLVGLDIRDCQISVTK